MITVLYWGFSFLVICRAVSTLLLLIVLQLVRQKYFFCSYFIRSIYFCYFFSLVTHYSPNLFLCTTKISFKTFSDVIRINESVLIRIFLYCWCVSGVFWDLYWKTASRLCFNFLFIFLNQGVLLYVKSELFLIFCEPSASLAAIFNYFPTNINALRNSIAFFESFCWWRSLVDSFRNASTLRFLFSWCYFQF